MSGTQHQVFADTQRGSAHSIIDIIDEAVEYRNSGKMRTDVKYPG